jgi:hypothetical protein
LYACNKTETIPSKNMSSHFELFSTSFKENLPKIQIAAEQYNTSFHREKDFDNISESEKMKEVLIPLIKDSEKLINEYGLTNEDMEEIFGESESENAIVLALLLFESNKNSNQNLEVSASTLFSTPLYAQTVIGSCVMEAFGLRELARAAYGQLSKAAMIKLATKVASKYMGPIGVGLAIAEFSYCMYNNY